MKHSESITKLAVALVAAQGELKAVGKDAVNPHFKNRYASLDTIIDSVRPVLARHNLAVVQGAGVPETNEHGQLVGFAVETMLVHSSGEWLSNAAIVPVSKSDAQGAGGALTYGRRYGLSALLSLATDDDDDGEVASRPVRHAQRAASQVSEPRTVPTPASGEATPAPAAPSCPTCGGSDLWDNRAENAERVARGEKQRPDFKCKTRGCDGVIWTAKGPTKSVKPIMQKSDEEAWAEAVASTEGADGLPF